MLKPLRHLASRWLSSARWLCLALAIALTSGNLTFAQDAAAIQKADELVKVADEVKVRETAAEKVLKDLQKKQAELQGALIKQKAELSTADKLVKDSEPKVKPEEEKVQKAEAAKKPVDDAFAAIKKTAEDTKKVFEAADAKAKEEQPKAEAAAKALADAQKVLADATEEEAKKKAQEEVTKAEAAKKAADEALVAAKKAQEDTKKAADAEDAKLKAEQPKVDAAAKALGDAQAALKTLQDSIVGAKKTVETGTANAKQLEEQIAAIVPQVQKAQADFTTVRTEHVTKRREAEKALIGVGKLVSFAESVAPVLSKRCLACHNAKTAKGRYNMETFAGIVKGGESGEAVKAMHSGDSSLLSLIADGSMPKDADPLTKEQIELVKKWIDTGAVLDAGFTASQPLIQIIPKEVQPPAPEAYPVPVPVTAMAFNHDGSLLATSGYHEVVLWNAADGTVVRRITNVAERVYDIEFTKDGQTVVVAAGTPAQIGEAKLFNVADGKLLGDLVRTDDAVFAVSLSADGKRLATAGADRTIRVFDVATQKQELAIEDHADWVMDVAWSPDGKKLASASRDKTSKVFDSTTGDSQVTFNSHGDAVYSVAFSPDGNQVITGGNDKQVRIWQPGDAKQIRNMGFGGEVFRVNVTPDGQIFSCSADKTARQHKVADGGQVRQFSGHTDWVYSVAVHQGAKRVAAGSYNGEVRIWNLDDGMEVKKFIAAPGYNPPQQQAAK